MSYRVFVSSLGAYFHRDDYFPRTNSYAFLLLSDTVIGFFILADLIEKFRCRKIYIPSFARQNLDIKRISKCGGD